MILLFFVLSYTITDIDVDTRWTDPDLIIEASGLETGKELGPADLQNAVLGPELQPLVGGAIVRIQPHVPVARRNHRRLGRVVLVQQQRVTGSVRAARLGVDVREFGHVPHVIGAERTARVAGWSPSMYVDPLVEAVDGHPAPGNPSDVVVYVLEFDPGVRVRFVNVERDPVRVQRALAPNQLALQEHVVAIEPVASGAQVCVDDTGQVAQADLGCERGPRRTCLREHVHERPIGAHGVQQHATLATGPIADNRRPGPEHGACSRPTLAAVAVRAVPVI